MFRYSDEIRIPIQQDLYTLLHESLLYVEEKLTINKRILRGLMWHWEIIALRSCSMRFDMNSTKIDRNRNVGITTTLKNYVIMSSERSVIARNTGWKPWNSPNGYFNFCIPLNMLLGFCEDYRRVVINARHGLILIRSRNDNNYLIGDPM